MIHISLTGRESGDLSQEILRAGLLARCFVYHTCLDLNSLGVMVEQVFEQVD